MNTGSIPEIENETGASDMQKWASADDVLSDIDFPLARDFSFTRDFKDRLDRIKPVITLRGDLDVKIKAGEEYNDEGAFAHDNMDGDISDQILVKSNIENMTSGAYTISYNVKDKAGNRAQELVRKITVFSKDNCENEHSWTLNFDQPTSVHIKFRNSKIGGRGAVFWINADFTESSSVSLYVTLELKPDNTQEMTLFNLAPDGTERELAKYKNLPLSFIDLWLSLDVDKNRVGVWIEGKHIDYYPYEIRSQLTHRFASIVGWESEAEFDFIQIKSCLYNLLEPDSM